MTDKSKRDQLLDLADTVADAILNMSNEEVLAELESEGVRPEDAGKAFDSLADSARMKAGQKDLAKARAEMKAQQRISAQRSSLSAEEARALVERAAKELPELTQAARNAKSGAMPESEVIDYANDLLELGYELDGDNDA